MSNRARVGSLWRPLLLVAALASSALAQPGLPPPTLMGTVRDSGGAPVASVRVSFLGVGAVTDSAGFFLLAGLRAGAGTLSFRRIGFEPRDVTMALGDGRADSLSVVLTILPQTLPGVTTEDDPAVQLRLSDFYRHRQNGMGSYFDRKQLEALRIDRISDALRRVPGIRVTSQGGRYQVRVGRTSGLRDCPPDFWLDGIRAPYLNVDDVPLRDVEALEVYKGPSSLPPELINRFGNPACGAVVIWTRVPG